MKNFKLLAIAGVTGVMLAGSFAAPALAWHPQVKITKFVQMADANDADSAVGTKPGDVIKYTMVIENTAAPASNRYNDLYFTKMTDTLPAGVELLSNPAQRTITEDLGILKPGAKVTKEYAIKVTSTTNGDVILNKACVNGNSKVNDAPRSDCDVAVIKVSVPPVVQEPPVEQPPVVETPEVLPSVGPANVFVVGGVATAFGYIANLLRLKRRQR